MLETLLAWVAPHQCLACRTEGSLLCANCVHLLRPAAGRCYRCRALAANGRTCPPCRRRSRLFAVRAATDYDGVAKELVRRLKFGSTRQAARVMADVMATRLPADQPLLITHMPTASSRIRRRGYDQAALLARAIAAQTDRPYLPCLVRLGQARQVGANRKQRLQQLQDQLHVSRPGRVRGRHVVLIDDVTTTGASLEAAAAALKEAGAKRVEAVVFARA